MISSKPTITGLSLQSLKASIRGQVIVSGDTTYEQSRKVYNAMIDKHPAVIIKCSSAADVVVAVNFARENNLLTAIRGGGHNCAGFGTCDNGVVIDLSEMKSVAVDPAAQTVQAGGGCVLNDIDQATLPFGLVVPMGINSTTGIGGLALGGGLGYLTRKFGLTIDNLLEVDMVLADGSIATVNSNQHADLFWAIRGGGGNFGIITSFLFKAHPLKNIYGGPMLWSIEDAKEVMKWYHKFIRTASDDTYGFFAFMTVPPGPPFPEHLHMKKMCAIVWCLTGSEKDANETLTHIRAFKKPAFDLTGPLPMVAIQSMFDALYPAGLQHYWKADFVNDLTDRAIDLHVENGLKLPTLLSSMHLYPINGAASRIGKNETAWNYRSASYAMVIVGIDPDPQNKNLITSWAKDYWTALHPYNEQGAYVNFMTEEGDDRIKASYGENYQRLLEIKKKYDANNLFRVNQNVS